MLPGPSPHLVAHLLPPGPPPSFCRLHTVTITLVVWEGGAWPVTVPSPRPLLCVGTLWQRAEVTSVAPSWLNGPQGAHLQALGEGLGAQRLLGPGNGAGVVVVVVGG